MHSELCINSPEAARQGRLAKQAGRLVVLESLSALRLGGCRERLEDETHGIISALGEP